MEIVATILSIISLLIAVVQSLFIAQSICSKSHLEYRRQLEEFEKTKLRIEEELNNERKKFK